MENFGMVTIGKRKRRKLKVTVHFGFQKLKGICSGI
jgi:hypothetical protein